MKKPKPTYYQCTNCKKIFLDYKEGMKHFRLVPHKWGGLEYKYDNVPLEIYGEIPINQLETYDVIESMEKFNWKALGLFILQGFIILISIMSLLFASDITLIFKIIWIINIYIYSFWFYFTYKKVYKNE